MCLVGERRKDDEGSMSCVSQLVARKCPPHWARMLWTPLEILLVSTTVAVGCGAALASTPLSTNLPSPGAMAAINQGMLAVLHALLEGPRLQLLPIYLSSLLLGSFAGFGRALGAVAGVVTLLLLSSSLLLCYQMPKLIPVGGRGPFAVGIATEYIRTPSAQAGMIFEKEPWPLELMAQVFYPVEPSLVKKLPWFPYTLRGFRRSLMPAWGTAQRMPFGLTQAGLVGAGVMLATARSRLPDPAPSLGTMMSPSLSSDLSSEHAWVVGAAVALCLTCMVSDLRQGVSRSGFKARYISREAAKCVARFVKMPGWITEPVCGFGGPGFDAGYFHDPNVPCFPVAPVKPSERKRPVVLFSHGLGGNRALYSEHAAEMASHGYIAVFLEHNDASGSSCILPDGRITRYAAAPNASEFAAPENRSFRLAQLRRRVRELKLTQAHLSKLENDFPTDFEACRRVGMGSVIDTKRPALVGHSFGGATILQLLSDECRSNGEKSKGDYSMAFVMDAWTFPISDEAREQSVKIPLIMATTDAFLGVEGAAREARLVDSTACAVREENNHLVLQIKVKDAAHNNFSDTTLFAPGIMQELKNAGKIDVITFNDQIARLVLCSLEVFLRRRTESGDADKTSPPSGLSSVLLGVDLPKAFPEARAERVCASGVLPTKDLSP